MVSGGQLAPLLLPSLTAAVRSGEVESGEAKAALVWVLGEFGEGDASIPEAPYLTRPYVCEQRQGNLSLLYGSRDAEKPEVGVRRFRYLIEEMIDEWEEEKDPAVKTELLTAAMKLFFVRAGEMQLMLGRLLKAATADAADVDVHDRALFYYRLLAADPNEAKAVVTGSTSVDNFDQEELKESLLEAFGTLSVVYNLPEDRWLSPEALAYRDKVS